MTGKPRSIEDLIDAKHQVEIALVRDMSKIPPGLFVYLLTIKDALDEVIEVRRRVKEKPNAV